MMHRQRGVTMIGWIFLLTPVALVLYAGIVAGPKYLNYYKVVEAMKKTATKLSSVALESRIDADLALGRHVELVGELQGLLVENPLRERLTKQKVGDPDTLVESTVAVPQGPGLGIEIDFDVLESFRVG